MKNIKNKSMKIMHRFKVTPLLIRLALAMVFITPTVKANPYNLSILANQWFNTDILVTNTTAGVLLYFFIFILFVGMIVLAEHTKMPVLIFLTGVLGMFIGMLFYVIISAMVGFMFVIISIIYMIRAGMVMKEDG